MRVIHRTYLPHSHIHIHVGVQITPLPEHKKPQYLLDLIADGVSKGAAVVNTKYGGGDLYGSLMRPAVVYPVTSDMRLWHEEQFGPVIPIAVYNNLDEIYTYLQETTYGQQAAVFISDITSTTAAPLIDILSTAVGRINVNTQCGRSPDALPFSGRRSSALGVFVYVCVCVVSIYVSVCVCVCVL